MTIDFLKYIWYNIYILKQKEIKGMCEYFKPVEQTNENKCENCVYYEKSEFFGCPADWSEKSIICED